MVKLFIGTLIYLAETLNKDNKRLIKCFSVIITQSKMQTTAACSAPGSTPLGAASPGPQGPGGERGCRQRCRLSVTTRPFRDHRWDREYFFLSKKKRTKAHRGGTAKHKMKQCESKITVASGSPLMGALLPRLGTQACLNVSSQWSYA